jgi:hypothetical protein
MLYHPSCLAEQAVTRSFSLFVWPSLLFHRKKEGRRSERRFFAIKPAHTHTHTQADADTHALFAECQRAIRYWNVKDRRKQQEIRMKAEVGGREEGRERVAKQ